MFGNVYCDCGNTILVDSYLLNKGKKPNCGCQGGRYNQNKDLTGQRFGKLVVTSLSDERRDSDLFWNCVCDCGNTALVRTHHLIRGAVKSCGCLHHENQDISGQRRGHLTAVRRTGDKDEFGSNIYEWRCDCGKIVRQTIRGTASPTRNPMCPDCLKKVRQKLANELRERIERDPETGIDRKTLSNIIAGRPTATNSSGVRGVYWDKSKKKWIVNGRENRKPLYLGSYDTLEEAKAVREAYVRRVYGSNNSTTEGADSCDQSSIDR